MQWAWMAVHTVTSPGFFTWGWPALFPRPSCRAGHIMLLIGVLYSWAKHRNACPFKLVLHWLHFCRFYYVDIFMIVLVYVPCMCVAGWYYESDPDTPWKVRLNDLVFVAFLETLVAASALLYCMFLMPVFFQITSSWGQLAWLCIAHPLYFEVTTGYIVRKALFRNIKLERTNVVSVRASNSACMVVDVRTWVALLLLHSPGADLHRCGNCKAWAPKIAPLTNGAAAHKNATIMLPAGVLLDHHPLFGALCGTGDNTAGIT
eukprot:365288-Chlamydomonas_euryale.AAC.1